MILQRQPDGTYAEITFISDGMDEIGMIVDGNGDVYYLQGYTAEMEDVPPLKITSTGQPLTEYQIYGNTVQNGTPSPDNPAEVRSVGDPVYAEFCSTDGAQLYGSDGVAFCSKDVSGYAIPITVYGKNLFDKELPTQKGYISKDGNIEYQENWLTTIGYIKCSVSIITVSSKTGLGSGTYINCYDINKNLLGTVLQGLGNNTSKTLTLSYGTCFIRVCCRDNALSSYQIESGTTVTEYEPYQEPITTTIYLDEPLRKIGNIADVIDFKDQKIVRNIQKTVFDGSENISLHQAFESHSSFRLPVQQYVVAHSTVLSTHQQNIDFSALYNGNGYGVCAHNSSLVENLYISIHNIKQTDDMKSFIKEQHDSGTPVTVYYQGEEPTIEPMPLPEIPTCKGTTIIDVDTEVKPSNMYIQYKSKEVQNG